MQQKYYLKSLTLHFSFNGIWPTQLIDLACLKKKKHIEMNKKLNRFIENGNSSNNKKEAKYFRLLKSSLSLRFMLPME